MSSSSEKRRDGARPDQTQDKLLDLVRPVEDVTGTQPVGETADEAIASAKLPLQSSYGNAAVARSLIQRKANDEPSPQSGPNEATVDAAPSAPRPQAPSTVATTLIVDDNVDNVAPGQIRKSQFLAQLRAAVADVAADALAGTIWSASASPYLEHWFVLYSAKSSQQIEQEIRRYAPEAAAVQTANDFVPIITSRVRRSINTWVATGKMPGLPEGQLMGLPGTGLLGNVGGAVAGVVSDAANAISALGGLFFKERDGGARSSDPQTVQSQLGTGQTLDGGARTRMESAFGQNFSDVQVHADAHAGELASNLNARAFTVGQHIAFGAGEYQPGTLIGDALIAHELTHVLQQRGGTTDGPAQKGTTGYGALEADADQAAVGAVVSSWGGARKGLAKIAKKNLPGLKSGLRLQRCDYCGGSTPKKAPPAPRVPIPPPTQGQTYEDWLKTFPGFTGAPGPGHDEDLTSLAPAKLQAYITGPLGVPPDCADVSLLLRHYYLESQGKTFTFTVGPPKKQKKFTIGAGTTDQQVGKCMIEMGSVNFQEDRYQGTSRLVRFYEKRKTNIRNLKELLDAGLKPGDLLVWKRLSTVHGNFEGHVQTVQSIDRVAGVITLVQGNMSGGVGVGALQQRQRTFLELTGAADGNADILDATEESFFGAGPWME